MNRRIQHLLEVAVEQPGKLWAWVLLPFITIALVLCLFSGDCSLLTADQRGARQFNNGEYESAADSFTDPQWKAAALYRTGNFEQAAAVWTGYDTPEGNFNQANSLVMLGRYEQAVDRYKRALSLQPGWEEAEENLQIAKIRAERLEQEGGNVTGGKMEADEIVFDEGKSSPAAEEETVEEQVQLSDAEMRAVWLRNVQTRPADFLRSKFAYQAAAASRQGNGVTGEKGEE